jgi:hypothetical protein
MSRVPRVVVGLGELDEDEGDEGMGGGSVVGQQQQQQQQQQEQQQPAPPPPAQQQQEAADEDDRPVGKTFQASQVGVLCVVTAVLSAH